MTNESNDRSVSVVAVFYAAALLLLTAVLYRYAGEGLNGLQSVSDETFFIQAGYATGILFWIGVMVGLVVMFAYLLYQRYKRWRNDATTTG